MTERLKITKKYKTEIHKYSLEYNKGYILPRIAGFRGFINCLKKQPSSRKILLDFLAFMIAIMPFNRNYIAFFINNLPC